MLPTLTFEYTSVSLIAIAIVTAFWATLYLYSGRRKKMIKTPVVVTLVFICIMWVSWFAMIYNLKPTLLTQYNDAWLSLLLSLVFLLFATAIERLVFKKLKAE